MHETLQSTPISPLTLSALSAKKQGLVIGRPYPEQISTLRCVVLAFHT